MDISAVSPEDISRIAFLENAIEGSGAASEKTLELRRIMFNDGFLAAKNDSKLIGYIETCIWQRRTPEFNADPAFFSKEHSLGGSVLYIIFVGVEECQRRHGVGSKLVRKVIDVGYKFSVECVHAVARDPIIPFYKSMGFEGVKLLPGFLPDEQKYTLMEFRM